MDGNFAVYTLLASIRKENIFCSVVWAVYAEKMYSYTENFLFNQSFSVHSKLLICQVLIVYFFAYTALSTLPKK